MYKMKHFGTHTDTHWNTKEHIYIQLNTYILQKETNIKSQAQTSTQIWRQIQILSIKPQWQKYIQKNTCTSIHTKTNTDIQKILL